jgi:hypothetical protein
VYVWLWKFLVFIRCSMPSELGRAMDFWEAVSRGLDEPTIWWGLLASVSGFYMQRPHWMLWVWYKVSGIAALAGLFILIVGVIFFPRVERWIGLSSTAMALLATPIGLSAFVMTIISAVRL